MIYGLKVVTKDDCGQQHSYMVPGAVYPQVDIALRQARKLQAELRLSGAVDTATGSKPAWIAVFVREVD
jgi:hypothetical protein